MFLNKHNNFIRTFALGMIGINITTIISMITMRHIQFYSDWINLYSLILFKIRYWEVKILKSINLSVVIIGKNEKT